MGDPYTYRSYGDLYGLGEQIYQRTVALVMKAANDYDAAEDAFIRYANRVQTPGSGAAPIPGYLLPTASAQDPTPLQNPADIQKFVAAVYQGLPELFTAFSVPDPAAGMTGVVSLYRTAALLRPDLQAGVEDGRLTVPLANGDTTVPTPVATVVSYINNRMQNWEGAGATAFTNYLAAWDISAQIQQQLTISLAVTLRAQIEIKKAMLTDVWNVGEMTLKALSKLSGHCPSATNIGIALTVGGAIASVLLAIPTDGTSLIADASVLGAEGINGAASILTNLPSTEPTATIGGSTAFAVIDSMQAALTKIHETVTDKMTDVANCINDISTELHAGRARSIVDIPNPGQFASLRNAGARTMADTYQFYER